MEHDNFQNFKFQNLLKLKDLPLFFVFLSAKNHTVFHTTVNSSDNGVPTP
jgi:hypothetical protein